ncbi:MAG: tetratricopeptide repeat protein [Thermodesulfovibrionales bacterium]
MKSLKKTQLLLLAASLALIALGNGAVIQQTAGELFEKALYVEEGQGDLQKAIGLYQDIVKRFPENREIAAKALLHIGLCHEKLGSLEAQKAYQRLIADYPGQKEEVALAKERLAGLAKITEPAPRKPNFRKIRTPFSIPRYSGGCLSPDGKRLAFGSQNFIWTVPIQGKVDPDLAGEPNKLPGTAGTLGQGLTWSGDGQWIAFSRAFHQVGGGEIKFNPEEAYIDVISSSGGEPRRIAIPQWVASLGATFRELGLSPDGKTAAFDSGGQLFTASVETGTIKQVTKDGGMVPSYSPDGTKIAYLTPLIMQGNPPLPRNDLWVIPAAGGDPVKVSGDLPELIRGSTWSPDGRMIAYLRHNTSTKPTTSEVRIALLSDGGRPVATPVRIKLPYFSRDRMTGWTPDNKIGLLLEMPPHDYVYTVPVLGGKASQVSPLDGFAQNPQWSPDGKRIYFRWEDGRLAFVPSEGGELSIHPALKGALSSGFFIPYPGGGCSVSPDGKSVVFSAGTVSAGPEIWTIPVEEGEPKKITSGNGPRFPCWSPDGRWIAYLGSEVIADNKNITTIFKVRAEGGEAKKITTESANVAWACLDWSPDGKSMAFFSKEADALAGTLNVMQLERGEPRVICQVQDVSQESDLSWSPDGKKIAFVSQGKIWVVPAEGGEPVEVKTDVDADAINLDWSPDGRKIAFTGRSSGNYGNKEFWFMEDFLHLLKK